jgi:lipoic acid synthetase
MRDLRDYGCDIVTIGQYLRPSLQHLPVARYYEPAEYDEFVAYGREIGLMHVEAGPLVRSSYHAEKQVQRGVRSDAMIPLQVVDRG